MERETYMFAGMGIHLILILILPGENRLNQLGQLENEARWRKSLFTAQAQEAGIRFLLNPDNLKAKKNHIKLNLFKADFRLLAQVVNQIFYELLTLQVFLSRKSPK